MKLTYKVVPFVASVNSLQGAETAAQQLESLIASWAGQGWKYVRMEQVETYIAGSAGCFGLGAQPGRMVAFSMVVFAHEGTSASGN